MIDLKIDGKPYQLPDSWNELTENQLLHLVMYLYADAKNPNVRMSVFKILLPLKPALLRAIHPEDIFRLQEACRWIWEKPLEQKILQEFKFEGKTYLLPEANFENVCLIEYAMADFYTKAFSRPNPDFSSLELLVATLCRPEAPGLNMDDPEWNGDQREKYNSKIAERRAQAFSRLPMQIKIIVLYYFLSAQKSLQEQYHEIYEHPEEKTKRATGPNFGWIEAIDNLAEEGTFGDWEKTAYANLHTICFHLRKKYYRRKDQARQ